MSHLNPHCDGGRCMVNKGEIRKVPLGGGANLLLCRHCYNYEMVWRYTRNFELESQNAFPILNWEELEVYE